MKIIREVSLSSISQIILAVEQPARNQYQSYTLYRVFWLNITKSEIYLRYRHCSKLFRELRKESEFQRRCCRNSTKVWERKRKSGREKILNFDNHITEIPAAQICWPKTNCSNVIAEIGKTNFVAMPLPKMGGKKINK